MNDRTIFVCGGDGFCGWPLSLRLSNNGYRVVILDNLSRRNIDSKLSCNSLTPIKTIQERIKKWEEITKKVIYFEFIDLSKDYNLLCKLVNKYKPFSIIHLGEQRSAPYSMKNSETRRYTVNNNLNSTNNILNAIVETNRKDIHLIHLGTMGVYGYGSIPDTVIPEGYINVKMCNKKGEYKDVSILHPSYPGSIYHMTKTQDALLFQFFCKNYNLKITDLHQGIIWGFETKETSMHSDLINRFDYDSDYGTVLNRFIMQTANNIPLTVYGTGEQTRAFIHINNSMDCIELALNNPPKTNKVQIYNQMTETHDINYIVRIIKEAYPLTEKSNIENPRKELIKNSLEVNNTGFITLGMKPIKLNVTEIKKIYEMVKKYNKRVVASHILPKSFWD